MPNVLRKIRGLVSATTTTGGGVQSNWMKLGKTLLPLRAATGFVPGSKLKTAAGLALPLAAQFFAPTIGEKIGSAIGGQSGAQIGQTVGNVASFGIILGSIVHQINSVGKAAAESSGKVGIFKKALTLSFLPPQAKVAVAVIATIGFGLKKLNDHLQENARLNRLAFAGGIKPLENFDSKLKSVEKSIKDSIAARELMSTAFTSAGIPGLVVTAKQFADVREQVSKAYPDLVKLLQKTPDNKLSTVATSIKAQLVSLGESAKDANLKVAALLSEAGKGGFLSGVLGDKSLQSITDPKSAISSMLESLSKLKTPQDFIASL